MARIRTHYDNLKVSRDAPAEVIKSAYRALANKYHPDRHGGNEAAMRAMKAINVSYEILIDPEKRRAHDIWIDENTRSSSASAQQSDFSFHQQGAATRGYGAPDQTSGYESKGDIPRPPAVGCSVVPALLTALTLLLLAIYAMRAITGEGEEKAKQTSPSEAKDQTSAGAVVEVRKAIPVDPEKRIPDNPDNPLPDEQTEQVSQATLENRSRAINGQIFDSDILVVRGSRMERGTSVPFVSVSVFGQQVAEARKNTYELPDRRLVAAYTIHFPNNSPGFPIFLKRDNRSFNLVCLDASEIVGILNRAFDLHRNARSSQAASFRTEIPTGVTLASGSSFDGWLSGTASAFVFNWKLGYFNMPPDQYPLIEGNDCFPSGNLQCKPEIFTLYDAIVLEVALKTLLRECSE